MRAITRPLADVIGSDPDLNDVACGDGYLFVRDGVGVAGRGVAQRVKIDDAVGVLAAIKHDGTVEGVTPLALGSIPFVPGASGELIIPEVTVGKGRDGLDWVTWFDDVDPTAALAPISEPVPFTANYTIGSPGPAPTQSTEKYLDAVTAARDAVRAGVLTKAVIARLITVTADVPMDIHAILQRLKASFGSCYRYSIDGFVGASPELLIEIADATVRSHPLAGTTRRTGDVSNDRALAAELQASAKNQIEHRIVIDVVHDTLLPWASYLDWEPEPSIVSVANVQHLGTRMEGRLSQPGPSVIELVRSLSPTPALGGHPRAAALDLISDVEGFERGRYGGAVGWVDSAGNGTWAVAIRCAEFSADRKSARLVAGGGIVADSEPLAELAETQAKFQAMLSAIVRP
jgi:menaquinone-specific isochorismate synthase